MGNGLFLLLIVGAWLAVLVPMALRSHDSSTSLSSVDRFNDAMRVLSRREQAGRGSVRAIVRPVQPVRPAPPVEPTPGIPVAVRRRRVLLTLVALSALTLFIGILGSAWGYVFFLVFAGLSTAFVVHLRRQQIRREERLLRSGPWVGSSADAVREPRRVAGIPDRMPMRPVALSAPLPAPASRYEDPHPVAATWDPVAWPVPTYVNAPVAPPRPPRVLDLTRPGEWSAALEGEDVGLGILDEDDELDGILDRRRASGDW